MLRALKISAILLAITIVLAGASSDWPPLPRKKFISGRPAHKADVVNGRAVFVAEEVGKIQGKPMRIAIPQYAYLRDTKTYVIVIQAEEALGGLRLFGVRGFDGQTYVALESDIELLGKTPRKAR